MGWLARLIGYEDEANETSEDSTEASTVQRGKLLRWHIIRGRKPTIFPIKVNKLEDALKGAEKLLEGSAVIVNLQHIDFSKAQRVVDMLAGVSYALRGSFYEIGKRLFLFTPSHIEVPYVEKTIKAIFPLFMNVDEITEVEHELPVR